MKIFISASYKVVCAKNNTLLSYYSCDFDKGLCGFNVATNPRLWTISRGANETIQSDHTTSKLFYLYVYITKTSQLKINTRFAPNICNKKCEIRVWNLNGKK